MKKRERKNKTMFHKSFRISCDSSVFIATIYVNSKCRDLQPLDSNGDGRTFINSFRCVAKVLSPSYSFISIIMDAAL